MMRFGSIVLAVALAGAAHAQTYLGHGELVPPRPEYPGLGIFGFGQSVLKVDGTLVVGAASSYMGSGMVVFHERVAGVWVERQQLTSPDAALGEDYFGFTLARVGGDLFIGAPYTEVAGVPLAGVVYRATLDTTSGLWSVVEMLEPPTPTENGLFGYALAASGGILFVGAPHAQMSDDLLYPAIGDSSSGGRVFAFEADGAGDWVPGATYAGETDLPGDAFGATLAADDSRLIVAAVGEGVAGEGAIYAFDLADPTATPVRFVDDSGTAGMLRFGRALSLAGNRLLVGADNDDDGYSAPGAAHVLELDAGTITRIATLTAPGAGRFGWSVLLLDEGQALVGAPTGGAVYHYIEADGAWPLVQKITEPVQSHFTDVLFGERLFLNDGELRAGAPSSMHHAGMSSGNTPVPSFSQGGKLYEIPLVGAPLADLTLQTTFPAAALEGSQVELSIVVAGDAEQDVSAAYAFVRVYLDIVTKPDGCSEFDDFIFRCEFGAIPAGTDADARFIVAAPPANIMKTTMVDVYVGSELADPDTSDNHADYGLEVVPVSAGQFPGDGGGGALGWLWALFLLGMLEFRFGPRRSPRCSAPTSASPVSTPNSR